MNPINNDYWVLGGDHTGDFQYFSDFLGRLQPLITTPEKPQIKVILCQNETRGGIYILT